MGCLALGGWFFAAGADEKARAIFRESLWPLLLLPLLISLPLGALALMAEFAFADFVPPFVAYLSALLTIVIFEEAFKLRAAYLKDSGIRAFAFVSLFGIFELMLFKPLMLWGVNAKGEDLIWLNASLLPALAMHTLTAVIYAFHLRQRPGLQFAICGSIHLLFNLAADHSPIVGDGIWLAVIFPLAATTWWLMPRPARKLAANNLKSASPE